MKKPQLKAWNWADPIYDTGVMLFVGDFDATHAKLAELLGKDNAEAFKTDCRPLGRTLWLNAEIGSGVIVWLSSFTPSDGDSLAVLVHELHHATFYVLCSRGLRHSEESDEAFAYHKAWLFRQCFARLTGKLKDGRIA